MVAWVDSHGPLEMELDPAAPSLEQLWEGKPPSWCKWSYWAPGNGPVQMFVKAGEALLFERQLPPVTLPLSAKEWTRHFEAHIKNDKSAQAHTTTHTFVRSNSPPTNLVCSRFAASANSRRCDGHCGGDSSGFVARLRDDADSDAPVIERYSFETPAIGRETSSVVEHTTYRALVVYTLQTTGDFKAAIVVPPVVETALRIYSLSHGLTFESFCS